MNNFAEVASLVVILGLSITFHEFMHAFVSYKLGDDTAKLSGRITLNPLAHIDPFMTILMPIIFYLLAGIPIGAAKPVPFNPYRLRYGDFGSAIVAAAGPLTNLALASFIAVWLQIVPAGSLVEDFFLLFVLVNIAFFVFNMIPFPPLDGSRVLYAFVPEGLRRLMRQIETFGIFGIVLFIFLLFPLLSPLIGSIINGLLSVLLPGLDLSSF